MVVVVHNQASRINVAEQSHIINISSILELLMSTFNKIDHNTFKLFYFYGPFHVNTAQDSVLKRHSTPMRVVFLACLSCCGIFLMIDKEMQLLFYFLIQIVVYQKQMTKCSLKNIIFVT